MKRIYLDHAATTPVAREVLEAMKEFFDKKYGNASSLHSFGREAKQALEKSRETIAKTINSKPEEIIFTSGGTEADNLAIKGVAFANKNKGKHIITSKIEHHAVLNTCKFLEKNGFEITYLPIDKYGFIDINTLKNTIKKETILVSVMHANNEIGTIEPIKEIGKICHEKNILFHTDAVQTLGKIPIDVEKTHIDLLSASSHKIYGPKGVGFLYKRSGVDLQPLLHGGGHEYGLRSGTENVAGIVGFAKACELAKKEMTKEEKRLTKLRDFLIKKVLLIPDSDLNGHPTKRLAGNASFCFKYVEGESMIFLLDEKGIAASTGSACSSPKLEPSHVLLAIGLSHVDAHGSLRLTLGRENTKEDIDYVLKVLPGIVDQLRKISPLRRK